MSLINQMLRDLEKRNAARNQSHIKTFPTPEHDLRHNSQKRSLVTLSGLMLTLLVAAWLFRQIATAPSLHDFFTQISPLTPTTTVSKQTDNTLKLAQFPNVQPSTAPIISTTEINNTISRLPGAQSESTMDTTAENRQALAQNNASTPSHDTADSKSDNIQQNKAVLPVSKHINTATTVHPMRRNKQRLSKYDKANIRDTYKTSMEQVSPSETPIDIAPAAPVTTAQPNLEKSPPHLESSLNQAKSLISQKRPQDAIKLLQNIHPDPTSKETYLALIAAANQQSGNAKQASATYQQLVAKKPGKAEYWLGLAIAEENNGHISAAREAYAKALSKNSLNTPVIDYIKQRQTALDSE